MGAQRFDAGRLTEFVAAKVRRNNEERRAAWRYRICAGIDAARREPITAAEIRERLTARTRSSRRPGVPAPSS